MRRVSTIIALPLLALLQTSCATTTMSLYSGKMELISVSGSGCLQEDMTGKQVPVELSLEQGSSSAGQRIDGYFSGPDIQGGHFFGNDLDRLQVVYPDEPDAARGHTLVLATAPEGANGELHEKPQADSTNCYFEKAALNLKREATGSEARSGYDRQSRLFSAEAYYMSGQSLLKENKPEEAIRELTRSLKLRNKVNPNDPDRAYPTVSLAVAHIVAGREAKALGLVRELFGENKETEDARIKQRMAVSIGLCNDEQYLESDVGQKASIQLMDVVAREFGSLDGVAVPLAACYFEMGKDRKEQDDPDTAIEFFRKAFKLNPDNPESITGVVMSFIDKDDPAEGRRYLKEHEQIFIKRAGKEPYDALLSYLYDAEAQQAENSGDLPRAEELSREAVKARPSERTLVIDLSRVLGREAKFAEARRLLEDGGKGCGDETCRKEFSDELARQDLIERMVKRIEAFKGSSSPRSSPP
jgi:tetratricopeptide (TPR) repeat protein